MKIIKLILLLIIIVGISPVYAWSNGGYSTNINNPKYGTHDMILQKAVSMLPSDMKNKIDIKIASYGSELPDCKNGTYCISDLAKHHVYYYSNGTVQDNASAVRAQQEYDLAKSYYENKDTFNFSLHVGIMSHYISDLSVFGHTMGVKTDWGAETHHGDYESYVESNLSSFSNVEFDGRLEKISAYDATLKVAKETTFNNGIYTNKWMDSNYNWLDPKYVTRTKSIINYSTNIITDVIYTLEYKGLIIGKATGSGNIIGPSLTKKKATFRFTATNKSEIATGNMRYTDNMSGINIKGSIDNLIIDGNKAVLSGTTIIDKISMGYNITVVDNGEPGKGKDLFTIEIPKKSYKASGVLTGGNIKVTEN